MPPETHGGEHSTGLTVGVARRSPLRRRFKAPPEADPPPCRRARPVRLGFHPPSSTGRVRSPTRNFPRTPHHARGMLKER